VLAVGCSGPTLKLFSDATFPLKEYTLQGKGAEKILVIHVQGILTNSPRSKVMRSLPSPVQEVVAHIQKAAEDSAIKAVILNINTPGGTTTASDILYHELMAYKRQQKVPVVSAMMDVAASGGYYIALASDKIVAHPTSVTGSVGVVMLQPKVFGLMDKIGLEMEVSKSGDNKDMGSPFRENTINEQRILQDITDDLGERFVALVAQHRDVSAENLRHIATGRVFLAQEAFDLGMVDQVGYLQDAIQLAREMGQLPENPRIVTYRRTKYPDDNLYNPSTMQVPGKATALFDLGLDVYVPPLRAGFYYLWVPGWASR
jgi:protease-4